MLSDESDKIRCGAGHLINGRSSHFHGLSEKIWREKGIRREDMGSLTKGGKWGNVALLFIRSLNDDSTRTYCRRGGESFDFLSSTSSIFVTV
jgi:hypothetical protein